VVNDFNTRHEEFSNYSAGLRRPRPGQPVWGSIKIFNYNISLLASKQVGLHPQLVSYDVTDSNGFNIGKNPDQTACSGVEINLPPGTPARFSIPLRKISNPMR